MGMIKDGHLGGFVDGGDIRCYYPKVWDAMMEDFNVKSMIDVGCGEGHSSLYFKNKGVDVLAIDGSRLVLEKSVFQPIIIHDYCTGPYIPQKEYDLVWCCEFVEHVEEQYASNFIETFKKAKCVVMTHAFPGQGGYHHVNEREPEYWINLMEHNGFVLMSELLEKYRSLAHDYFEKSGLVFMRI